MIFCIFVGEIRISMDEYSNFDLIVLNAGYSRHNSDWNFGPICSSFSRIYLVSEGSAFVEISGKTYCLSPGHLYLIPALSTHTDACNGLFGHYYIHFLDRSNSILYFYQKFDMPFELEADKFAEMLVHRLLEVSGVRSLASPLPSTYDNSSSIIDSVKLFQNMSVAERMECAGGIMQLLSMFVSRATPKTMVSDMRIQKVLWQIENNVANVPSVDELAGSVSLCKDRFIRLFASQTGYTPANYVARKKIMKAQMMFISGVRSVKSVALAVGYVDVSYFGKVFKRISGMSPMEFVRQNA